jgi:hypothetical protein
MPIWLQIALTIFTSVLASSGLWAFLASKLERDSAEKDILIGIGHIELVFFGMQYIERGWITQDEYETMKSLYEPYKKLGGNGSGTKIMQEVEKLPMHSVEVR